VLVEVVFVEDFFELLLAGASCAGEFVVCVPESALAEL
jgi:hypothetical protein